MVVQSNVPAINAHRNLGINNSALSKNLEKLSSGYKINRAGDDAAGLAISEKMRSQIRGLEMAEQNTENAVSLIQTAEGGLNETHAILQRMRELAVQSSNGTYTQEDRDQITLEYEALKSEITRIADSTHYNGINLLNGNLSGGNTYKGLEADGTAITIAAIGIAGATASAGSTVATAGNINVSLSFNTDGSLNMAGSSVTTAAGVELGIHYDQDTGNFTIDLTNAGDTGTVSFVYTQATNAALADTVGKVDFTIGLTAATPTVPTLGAATATESWKDQMGTALVFQIGANGSADQRVALNVNCMNAAALGIDGSSVSSRPLANAAIDILDDAIYLVSEQRAGLGALQNRLEHTLNSLGVAKENLTAAESTIRDTDMAKEMMKFTQNSILVQASQAMLAQANALPQGILSLLS